MNVTVCPGCGAQNSFIKWQKTGTQTTLAGNAHEDVMEKRKAPVCGNCGRTYQIDAKGRFFLDQYGRRIYVRTGGRSLKSPYLQAQRLPLLLQAMRQNRH